MRPVDWILLIHEQCASLSKALTPPGGNYRRHGSMLGCGNISRVFTAEDDNSLADDGGIAIQCQGYCTSTCILKWQEPKQPDSSKFGICEISSLIMSSLTLIFPWVVDPTI